MAANEPQGRSANTLGSPRPATSTMVFPESAFFFEQRASALPPPAEIRALNMATGCYRATDFDRPSPVIIPSLGLFIKYGGDVTIAEAQTQTLMRERLRGLVPIPRSLAGPEDEGQLFIYMSLVEGDTLEDKWPNIEEDDRQAICKELRDMVNAWRALPQDKSDVYIGKSILYPLYPVSLV